MKKPSGEADGSHSALAEGYDFEKNCIICKNSWGGVTSSPRFDFIPSAAHRCNFYVVFFTIDSIRGKINGQYIPRIKTFNGTLKGKSIKCAWMDEQTATYETNYLCEHHPEKKDDLNYLGYDVYEWIDLNCKK